MSADNYRLTKTVLQEKLDYCIKVDSEYGVIQQKEFLEVSYEMTKQMMFDDLIDLLEDKLKIHVLYAQRTRNGRNVYVTLFSKPTDDKMYIIYFESKKYGVIERIHFAFYDSMENMNIKLKRLLLQFEALKKNDDDIVELEKTDWKKLHTIFT